MVIDLKQYSKKGLFYGLRGLEWHGGGVINDKIFLFWGE